MDECPVNPVIINESQHSYLSGKNIFMKSQGMS